MSLIPTGFAKSAAAGGFYDTEISQSLRLNDDDSAYLSRTPASAGNRKTWTWSGWVKRGSTDDWGNLFLAGNGSTTYSDIQFRNGTNNSTLQLYFDNGSGMVARFITSASYRDPSSWYHIVVAIDTTQSTSSNRVKIYVNGEQITSFSTESYPAQNTEFQTNNTVEHRIGSMISGGDYFHGYLAEVNFIDGTALDATSFGEFKSGVWIPKAYEGSYGTNGFYLPFNHDYSVEGFSATTYTPSGNVDGAYIGGVGFQPDLVWIKSRVTGYGHCLVDSVRGANARLQSDTTGAEASSSTYVQSFEADGFTLGTDYGQNAPSEPYVAWCWDAGSGSPVSNTDGSITSSVKASTDYGFSIVSYTGTGSNATVGHGLSSAPEMLIIKRRTTTGGNWQVYHSGISNMASGYITLNATSGFSTGTDTVWNATAPTSTVFSLGTDTDANKSGDTNIAYCFHSVSGYSKFGSYSGTGASGNSVTTGFKPAMVVVKRTDSADSWYVYDNVRGGDTDNDSALRWNGSDAESDFNATDGLSFTSTGFTVEATDSAINSSSGTYIYMAFADNREAAFWLDQSGNNNDFENNNLTESDISLDSPTNNFATFNPIDRTTTSITVSEGNLRANLGSYDRAIRATMAVPRTGKWYYEVHHTLQRTGVAVGFHDLNKPVTAPVQGSPNHTNHIFYSSTGGIYKGGSLIDVYTAPSTGDVSMWAIDHDAGKIWVGLNGTWFNSGAPASGTGNVTTTYSDIDPTLYFYSSSQDGTAIANFGQDSSFAGSKTAQGNTDDNGIGDFYYAPPSGYLALCTANLPDPVESIDPAQDGSPQDHFNTSLWTGNSSTQAITGVGFSPDLIWMKRRSAAANHTLVDTVRGITQTLEPNVTGAEENQPTTITAVGSDGYTLGSRFQTNGSGYTHVGWSWRGSDSSPVSNTDGSITSSVSANTDAGFSIVTYTANGTNGATFGHGLTSAPEIVIFKSRDDAEQWYTSTANITGTSGGYLILNSTAAEAAAGVMSTTAPSASVVTLSSHGAINNNTHLMLAYCFHSVEGFSKCSSYTGNGSSDGPFCYTGFRPAYVMAKRTDGADYWFIYDAVRNEYNVVSSFLKADASVAEGTIAAFDFTSNGFKLRTNDSAVNLSGGTYIYMAFADDGGVFKYSNAR